MNELSLLQALLFVKVFATTSTVAFFSPQAITGRINLEKSKLPLFGVLISRIPTPTVLNWSKISEYDVDSKSFWLIDADADAEVSNSTSSYSSIEYDLTSPREWLEYCETQQGLDDYGMKHGGSACAGAYTVIRCDFHLDKKSWNIWGKDFHFNRLQESYRSLLLSNQLTDDDDDDDKLDENLRVQQAQSALDSNTKIMNLLLNEAKKIIIDRNKIIRDDDEEEEEDTTIVVVMLTLLWEPDHARTTTSDDRSSTIRVRGHAFSTLKKVSQLQLNDVGTTNSVGVVNPNPPVQAVIGYLPPTTTTNTTTTTTDHNITSNHNTSSSIVSLPNRYQNFPQAKLSCWCRRRRLLEEMFKRDVDVGDVLLTKHQIDDGISNNQTASTTLTSIDSVELLEGLTSNIFVVYPGEILRTPPSTDVLGGYARQLIIDCAVKCGYQVEIGSIPLKDSSLWKEIFLTSSIRLIIPVHKLLLPSSSSSNTDVVDGNNNMPLQLETFWEMEHLPNKLTNSFDDNHHNSQLYAYDELYKQVMKQNNHDNNT